MATFNRKHYIIDKNFQINISIKAVVLPLISILIAGSVLLFFAVKNKNNINIIVKSQDQMIDLFLTTPSLINSKNPVIKGAENTFKNNIGRLIEIKQNSKIVLYFIVIMIIIQSIIIFAIFIFITHRVSGPIYVMTNYLKEIRDGKNPASRPLRKKDELKEFHTELVKTIEYLKAKKKK